MKRLKQSLPQISVIAFILFLCCYISANYYQLMLLQGDSMSPAYHNWQFTVIDKVHRDFSSGDVIAFRCDRLDSVLVKRIIACPGDRVLISNGALYVNGTQSHIIPPAEILTYPGIAEDTISLDQDEYFVLGDNHSLSIDSRYPSVGIVKTVEIIGKILPQQAFIQQ